MPKDITRIAIVISHPIQHFCPGYAGLANNTDWNIRVFFASSIGLQAYEDKDFGKEVKWGNLYLDDFDHVFLNDGAALAADSNLDAPDLDAALKTFNPDVLVLHGYAQPLQRRAFRWANKNSKRKLFVSDGELRQHRPWVRQKLKYLWLKRYFSSIDGFLTVGDANEAFYRSYAVPDSRLFRTGFSIDRPLYDRAVEDRVLLRSKVRNRWELTDEVVTLSMVGKLVDWKRQNDLIEALSLLNTTGPKVAAWIIGTGPNETALKQRAEKLDYHQVLFPGFVNPEDLPAYYAATDIYVHTAEKEPHSLAISEAIYSGCPVVISDRCGSYGPTDDVQSGTNGWVFRGGRPDDLANKVRRLVSDPTLRKQFGAASSKIAVNVQNRAFGDGLRAALLTLGL